MGGSNDGEQGEFHPGGMGKAAGESHAGEHGGDRGRAQRPLGHAERASPPAALAKAKADAGTNELIKAVVAEFGTAGERNTARDSLQARLQGPNHPAKPRTRRSPVRQGSR